MEHSFYDYGGHSTNPCIFLSAVAVLTKRIRLITGAVIPAFHHPAHLGGDLAMLDNISKGRLDAGFGRAFLPKEFEVYGVPMSESRGRFEESIGMIRRMWTEERVDTEGKYWNLDDVRLMPRVVQKPHPPVLIAAINSEESFVYAAKNGFNLMIVPYAGKPGQLQEFVKMYRRLCAESGFKAGAEQIQVSQFAYVAENSKEAHEGFARITQPLPRDVSPRPCSPGRAPRPTSTPATTRWWRASSPPRRRRSSTRAARSSARRRK